MKVILVIRKLHDFYPSLFDKYLSVQGLLPVDTGKKEGNLA
jgi:hypothetical protein